MDKNLLQELKAFLKIDQIITDMSSIQVYQRDGLSGYSGIPGMVLLPESENDIVKIVKICSKYKTPVVTRGAGTGLSGGAVPTEGSIVLSTSRLNKILKINPEQRLAVVQPGVRNIAISEKAKEFNLFYAPDPSSQIACSIGGNVAENSGGVHCLKYGLTLHNVVNVRAIDCEGNVMSLGLESFDFPGLDLLSLIVGSEGMLVVITEITVRLLPRPSSAKVIMASFNAVEDAANAVAGIISEGIVPAGLEMMDGGMVKAVEDFVHAGYDTEAAAILLCESDGMAIEVDEEIDLMVGALKKFGAEKCLVSADDHQRDLFWSGRKNAFPASGRLSPDYYCIDGTIPRKKVGAMLREIERMEGFYNLRCINVFHAGDGNLHPLILFDSSEPGEFEKTEKFGEEILDLCVKFGGTITGEHGVGLEKLGSMCVQFTEDERNTFSAVKFSFDKNNLFNPGKVIPVLSRCVEKGRKHVHKDNREFKEIPSF
jgi:glycolate oxidase